MRTSLIARNYAETLLALAERNGGRPAVQEFAAAADALCAVLDGDALVRRFLGTPRVSAAAKKEALRKALAGRVPDLFLRFVLVVVDKGRQGHLREVAAAYHDLVDEMLGQVRVHVTLAREPDAALQAEIGAALERRLARAVVPTFHVDADIVGGVVVRYGDQVLDGSVRRRAHELRRRMLAAPLPAAAV